MKVCEVEGCEGRRYCRGLCTKHYGRLRAHGDPTTILTGRGLPLIDRFLRLVAKTDGCWEWTGNVNPQGYGRFTISHTENVPAHRWIYEHTFGPQPEGTRTDHDCHNRDASCPGGPTCRHRRCVNPAHLDAVTPAENTRRRLAAGRRRVFRTHCKNGHEYPPFDANDRRRCRECRRATDARRRAARR